MLTKTIKPSLVALLAVGLGMSAWVMKDGYQAKSADGNPKIDKIKLQPGFVAEHLYGPSSHQQGSWVSMAFDDKGRLIASDQYGFIYRMVVPEIGSGGQARVEKLKIGKGAEAEELNIGYAHGLLYAFNSLYVVINNSPSKSYSKPSGLYRLRDTDGDDQFDSVTLLKELKGSGEHGTHSVVLAPDGKSLFVVAGNHTDLPPVDVYDLPAKWDTDNLFPFIKDPRGHANDRNAPGGFILKTDENGKKWELYSAGYRNQFDVAFNEAGEMFTYDADMEWDFGLPWYRPTRICHVTKGSEYGWRTGDAKWSPAYPDNLPAIKNIGQGSPTNLIYVNKARFPDRYKNTLFAFDWSFGIIHALHLKPSGGTYSSEWSEFLSGIPLPLTDGVVGPDGALYFMTGGRRLESDVYRVYYKDYKSIAPDANVVKTPLVTAESKLRLELEAFHGVTDPKAVDFAWPYLSHSDRFVAYAARLAVENQPVATWAARAINERDPNKLIYAALALARNADKATSAPVLKSLLQINYSSLSEKRQLDLLRTFEVLFYRIQQLDAGIVSQLTAYLEPRYPGKSASLNRELVKLLVFLQSTQVVDKTLKLMALDKEPGADVLDSETATNSADLINRNPQYGLDIAAMLAKMPPAQQTFYAFTLAQQKVGWTAASRETYFKWFDKAFGFKGGASYVGFIDKARQMALSNVPKPEYEKYNQLSGAARLTKNGNDLVKTYNVKGPGRGWRLEQADSVVTLLEGRSFETGKQIFSAILCDRCHAIGGEGEGIGPDLTQLGTRFSKKDILEAIIDPNKAVSDQYASTVFSLKNGQSIIGRLINEDKQYYYVSQNPFAPSVLEKVAKKTVVDTKYSTVSVMLPGLINGLNPDELKDLVAYLVAGGNQTSPVYKAAK